MINKTSTFQARRAAEDFIGYSQPPRNADNFMQVPQQLLQDEVHQTSEASCMQECDEGTLSCRRRGAKPDNLYKRRADDAEKEVSTGLSVNRLPPLFRRGSRRGCEGVDTHIRLLLSLLFLGNNIILEGLLEQVST